MRASQSDPFCTLIIRNRGGLKQTSTKMKTLEPKWNEEFELYVRGGAARPRWQGLCTHVFFSFSFFVARAPSPSPPPPLPAARSEIIDEFNDYLDIK